MIETVRSRNRPVTAAERWCMPRPRTRSLRCNSVATLAAALCLAAALANRSAFSQPPSSAGQPNGEPILKLGDPAPELPAEKWLLGEPMRAMRGNRVFVLVFVAPWSASSRAALTELHQLATDGRDADTSRRISLIAVSGPDLAGETAASVTSYANTLRSVWPHRFALDERGVVRGTYLGRLEVGAVPLAVVVFDGRLLWTGHPRRERADLAAAVEKALSGGVDWREVQQQATETGKTRSAARQAARTLEVDLRNASVRAAAPLPVQPDKPPPGPRTSFDPADVAAIIDLIAKLQKLDPTAYARLSLTRIGLRLRSGDDPTAAIADARSLLQGGAESPRPDAPWEDPLVAEQTAWMLMDHAAAIEALPPSAQAAKDRRERAAALRSAALDIAQAAVDATQQRLATPLDALARAQFETGAIDKAIATARLALPLASEGVVRDQINARLRLYESRQK